MDDELFRMNKMNISIGNDLYRDIEQLARNRLSFQTLSNVILLYPSSLILFLVLVIRLQSSQI